MATVRIEEGSLKEGLLGLVLALVEIVAEVLRAEAGRRVAGGGLTAAEVEDLGRALRDLDRAVAEIEADLGLEAAVASVRRGLDEVVERVLLAADEGERPW